MNVLGAAVLIVCLAACSSSPSQQHAQYDGYLSLMKGLSVEQLMKSWGRPEETAQLKNGSKALIYIEEREMPSSQYNLFTGTNETVRKTFRCRTSFEIGPDDHVRSYEFEGNGCGAKKMKTAVR